MGLFTKSTPAPATKPAMPAMPAAFIPGDGSDIVMPPALFPPARPAEHAAHAPLSERQLHFQQLKDRIHQQLVERLDVQNLKSLPSDTVRAEVRTLIRDLC